MRWGCVEMSKGRVGIDKYIKRKIEILVDLCIIPLESKTLKPIKDIYNQYLDRYHAAMEASVGDPYSAVDEEHYRILREKVF